ncbi:MAG: PIN domain-containing protein [Candidatus Hatepunaea meridiana]|nr:PIN domain-containing protein [Candidatus Hatepunaea meridiana]
MILTYLDSGVLIAAFRLDNEIAQRAWEILDDPNRVFASSIFVKIEVLPKPIFNRRHYEVEFYNEFFNKVSLWVEFSKDLVESAYSEATRSGLSAIDAFHVVSAASVRADELITTEKISKPIHRTDLVAIRSINE